jgi:threonine dehydratase
VGDCRQQTQCLPRRQQLGCGRLQAAVVRDGLSEAAQQQQNGSGNGSAGAAAAAAGSGAASAAAHHHPLVRDPEDFQLQPGELSHVERDRPPAAADVFRCAACTRPECQTAGGCANMQWRNAPGGYLREVLTAKVYDVAVETPLDKAEKLRWVLQLAGC